MQDWVQLDTLRQPQYVEDDLNDAPLVDAVTGKKRTPLYLLQCEEMMDGFYFKKKDKTPRAAAQRQRRESATNHPLEDEDGRGGQGDLSSRSSISTVESASADDTKGITHGVLLAMHKLGKPQAWSDKEFEDAGSLVRNALLRQRALFGEAGMDADVPAEQTPLVRSTTRASLSSAAPQLQRTLNARSLKLLSRDGSTNPPRYARVVSQDHSAELAKFDVIAPQMLLAPEGCGTGTPLTESTAGQRAGDVLDEMTEGTERDLLPVPENVTALSVADLENIQGEIISSIDLMQSKRQLFVPKDSRVVFDVLQVVAGPGDAMPPVYAVRYERPEPASPLLSRTASNLQSIASIQSAVFPALPSPLVSDAAIEQSVEVPVASVGEARAVGLVDKYEWERDKLKDDFDLVSPRAVIHESAELAMSESGGSESSAESSQAARKKKRQKKGLTTIRRISTFVGRSMLFQSDDEAEDDTHRGSTTTDDPSAATQRSPSMVRKGTMPQGTPATEAKKKDEILLTSPTPSLSGKPPLPGKATRLANGPAGEVDDVDEHPVIVFGRFHVTAIALSSTTVAEQRDAAQRQLAHALGTHQLVSLARPPPTPPRAGGGLVRVTVTFEQSEDFSLHPPRCMFGDSGEDVIEESTEGIFYDLLYAVEEVLAEVERTDVQSSDEDGQPRLPPGLVLRDGLLTPSTTPVKWSPEADEEYHMAPFLRMRIDKLDSTLDAPGDDNNSTAKEDSDDDDRADSDDEEAARRAALTSGKVVELATTVASDVGGAGGAPLPEGSGAAAPIVASSKQETEVVVAEAARARAAQEARRRNEAVERLKALSRTSHDERLLERYLEKSKTNIPPPGAPWLVLSQVPMRMEGVTAAVAKWLKASKKGGESLSALREASEKLAADRQIERESIVPSFRRLRAMMRLMNFGSLLAAMMTKQATFGSSTVGHPSTALETSSSVGLAGQLEELFVRERQRLQRQLVARSTGALVEWLDRYQTSDIQTSTTNPLKVKKSAGGRRRSTPARQNGAPIDESILAHDGPFFQHFLPSLSPAASSSRSANLHGSSAATRFAALRRHPRDVQLVGGLSAPPPVPVGLTPSSALLSHEVKNSRKGHESSRAMFSALQSRTPTPSVSSSPTVLIDRRRASSTTPSGRSRVQEVVAIQRSALQQLQPLRFDALHCDDQ